MQNEIGCMQRIEYASVSEARLVFEAEHVDKIAVIYDKNTFRLFSDKINSAFDGFELTEITVPIGEKGKTLSHARKIFLQLANKGFDKKDLIIGVGGGVVTDLTGYVAMQYMRGMRLALIPTTLLAMIDAAVGGKNACNEAGIKNLIGGFYMPFCTLIDTAFLKTLDEREIKSGMGELIKTQLLSGEPIFETYLKDKEKAIKLAVEFKRKVVSQDYTDKGLRRILNFGHTIGHALESLEGFSIPHGQAVVYGMKYAFYIGEHFGIDSKAYFAELERLARAADINLNRRFDLNKALQYIQMDKKSCGNWITMVLIEGLGKPVLVPVPKRMIGEVLIECE